MCYRHAAAWMVQSQWGQGSMLLLACLTLLLCWRARGNIMYVRDNIQRWCADNSSRTRLSGPILLLLLFSFKIRVSRTISKRHQSVLDHLSALHINSALFCNDRIWSLGHYHDKALACPHFTPIFQQSQQFGNQGEWYKHMYAPWMQKQGSCVHWWLWDSDILAQ